MLLMWAISGQKPLAKPSNPTNIKHQWCLFLPRIGKIINGGSGSDTTLSANNSPVASASRAPTLLLNTHSF